MRWIELSVDVHPEAVDAVANVFEENGTGGVAIHQPFAQDRALENDPEFAGLPTIRAYLPDTVEGRERESRIEQDLWHLQAFDLSPVGPMRRSEIEEEDWANGWKEHFHPLKIGRFVVKPTWREWQATPGELIMEMDPGMAFGTGLHPTTSLTLAALEERIRPGARVLDLGTGSGILAMGAAMLGAKVTAIDIDEVAVEVAERNARSNGLSDRITVERGTIETVSGRTFDLVLANIIAGVLIDIAPQLHQALGERGELLASGIIEPRADEVRQAFHNAGMIVVDEQAEGDWWLLVARKA